MRILHTADWHIGKMLYKHSLQEEMELFLDWLLEVLRDEKIDLLLISGDIFDVANPSVKDRGVYYKFLSQLIGTQTQVIITGGNHDSIGMLDAPNEILRHINISVIGGAKEDLKEELIPIGNSDGKVELVVAAVPFLRDRDLRVKSNNDKGLSRTEAIKAGIKEHYKALGELCQTEYPKLPALAMGHLFARGASTSESERDIHIGNAAAIESDIFPDVFGYVALGHIHRPQVIGGNEMIRYSGSPIALSFSEKEDKKCVLIVDLIDGVFHQPVVKYVPKRRELKKFVGTYQEVDQKLQEYTPQSDLISFVEIEVREEDFSSMILANVENLVSYYSENANFKILKSRTQFLNGTKDTSDLFEKGANIEDLKPSDVFDKRLEQEGLQEDKINMLKDAFIELLEDVNQSK